MAHRLLVLLLAAVTIFGASRVSAQDADGPPYHVPLHAPGYQIDGFGGGFTLVTHGVWLSPEATPSPAQILDQPTDSLPRPHLAATKSKLRSSNSRRTAYLADVSAAEFRFGLPAGLLDALIWTESRYNPFAISRAGATGLGQLMPSTARELGVANRFDRQANLWAAARYLRQLLDKFGMVHLALAAYNAGPGAVERAGGIPLNGETPSYVRNVLAFWRAG